MRITHLGHACLLVEMADVRLLIDPGAFVDDFSEAHDLDAVIVTHRHPDHLDPQRLPGIHADNPNAAVLCDPESVAAFADLGVEAREHGGTTTRIGAAPPPPCGERRRRPRHACPPPPTVGVRPAADGEPSFFHPGDALDAVPGQVDVLAFPLQAPWQRSRDMTAFLRRFGAPHAVPIHDGLLQRRGRDLYLGQAAQPGGPNTRIHDLAGAGPVEFRDGA